MSSSIEYRVRGWRRWLPGAIVSVLMLPGAIALQVLGQDTSDRRGALALLAAWLLMVAFTEWLVRYPKLTLAPDGLTLRQLGYVQTATWTSVVSFRTTPCLAFQLSRPAEVRGTGLTVFASMGSLTSAWLIVADDRWLALAADNRLVLCEPFTWHLRHGTLRDDLQRLAPHLAEDTMSPAANTTIRPTSPARKLLGYTIVAVLVVLTVLAIWGGVSDTSGIGRLVDSLTMLWRVLILAVLAASLARLLRRLRTR